MDTRHNEQHMIEHKAAGYRRLKNWACWAIGSDNQEMLALFYPSSLKCYAQYKSTEIWDQEDDYIDIPDAMEVNDIILSLPDALRAAVMHKLKGRPRLSGVPEKTIDGLVYQVAVILCE